MIFRSLIEAFREGKLHDRTQSELSGRALLFKRQLEQFGLFPGLRPGTVSKHKPAGRKDENGRTRGDRKRAARIRTINTINETRDHGVNDLDAVFTSLAPRYYAGQREGYNDFLVYVNTEDGPVVVAGPYGRRSTANRRAKQLNDGAQS